MKVFVSWSKSASRGVAEAFAAWLPRVIQECVPFISSDTEKGDAWFDTIEKNLADARVGVLFLTHENKNAAWLNYEAGALRTLRTGNMKRLCAVFVGMKPADYDGPLKNFQMTNFVDKDDMFKLLQAINSAADRPLDERRLEEEFNEKWDRLVADTAASVKKAENAGEAAEVRPRRTRSNDDKLDEVLDLLRELRFNGPTHSAASSEGVGGLSGTVSSARAEASLRKLRDERLGGAQPVQMKELVGYYLLDDEGLSLGQVVEAERQGDILEVLLNTGQHHRRMAEDFSFSPAPF